MRNNPIIKFLYGGPPPGLVGFGTFLCFLILPSVVDLGPTLGRRGWSDSDPLIYSPFVWCFLLGLFSGTKNLRARATTAGLGLVIFPLLSLVDVYLRFGNSPVVLSVACV